MSWPRSVAPYIFEPMSAHRSSSLITFDLGASGPSAHENPITRVATAPMTIPCNSQVRDSPCRI